MALVSQVFYAGHFPNQVLRLVDQDRQMLRTDPGSLFLIVECQQGNFVTSSLTMGAGRFFSAHRLPHIEDGFNRMIGVYIRQILPYTPKLKCDLGHIRINNIPSPPVTVATTALPNKNETRVSSS